MSIGLLTTGFAIISIAIIIGILYRLRRQPIVWLLRRADARRARHVAVLGGLSEAMAYAASQGDADLYARLERQHAANRAALLALDPKLVAADVPVAPGFTRVA